MSSRGVSADTARAAGEAGRERTGLVGIYGGTFNPIHLGHLRAAEEVVEALGLDCMLFVPSAEPPHKRAGGGEVIAPARQRLCWTRLALEGNPRFRAEPIEVERAGPSFSVETLRELSARLAPARLVFTLGCDAFAEMGTWREPETVFTLADLAVITRPPIRKGSLDEWLPDCVRDEIELAPDGRSGRHGRAGTWLRLVEIEGLDISATKIRERIRRGLSTRYLLPEPVRVSVEESGCYCREGSEESDA
jgi:nicotinate-nucleotide adenylyltransferase